MQVDMSSGLGQANLTLSYDHRKGEYKGFRLKDGQIFVGEFVGTYLLALLIATSRISDSATTVPFAIGCGLAALVYALGPISGGQLNPAASLALVLVNKLSIIEALYSVVAQSLGALAAGLMAYYLYDNDWDRVGFPQVSPSTSRARAFVGEYVQTFGLMSVAMSVAATKAQANNSYFGVAIGFVVVSGALVIGGVSGACFNPALAFLTFLQGSYDDLWVFMIAPLLGGLSAGLFFRVLNPHELSERDPFLKISKNFYNPEGNITRSISMLSQEFLGTFFLSWTVALSINVDQAFAAIAISFILISFIYAGGAVSGAHYNPIVTLAVYLRGFREKNQMRLIDVFLYIAVQIPAAFAGGAVAAYVNQGFDRIASPSVNSADHTSFQAILVECFFSAALIITVLTVATTESASGNSYFGLAIGFIVLASIVAVADISGGVFNPAIAIALPSLSGTDTSDIWVYIIGEVLGSLLGTALYKFWYIGVTSGDDEDEETHLSDHRLKSSLLNGIED